MTDPPILGAPGPHSRLFVTTDERERITGFVSGGAARDKDLGFDGEIYAIYLLTEHQGLGVGRAPFQKSVAALAEADFKSMILWALKDNPARRFYGNMGGKMVREKADDFGGAELVERT